jgi:hypothetical protein
MIFYLYRLWLCHLNVANWNNLSAHSVRAKYKQYTKRRCEHFMVSYTLLEGGRKGAAGRVGLYRRKTVMMWTWLGTEDRCGGCRISSSYSMGYGLRTGPQNLYPERGYLWLFSSHQGKCFKLGHDRFLPHSFQFTCPYHSTIRRCIVWFRESGRPQWPRGLRHELSSLARKLGSWVRIPEKAWMFGVWMFVCFPVFR